jgi:hypothetical protein
LEKLNKENGCLRKQVVLLKKENSKLVQDKKKMDKADHVIKIGKNKKKKKDKHFSDEKRSANDEGRLIAGYSFSKTELYIYDISKKYEAADVEVIIKNYSKVVSYKIKQLHKYQLVKVEIHLTHKWTNKILNKCCYTTVSYKGEILNLRHVFLTINKIMVNET